MLNHHPQGSDCPPPKDFRDTSLEPPLDSQREASWRPPMLEKLACLSLRALDPVLDRIGWEAVATPGRIWTPLTAPSVSAICLPGGGFAFSLGRWEVTVSPREYRHRA